MRKIEREMLKAIHERRDWMQGNTVVEVAQHVGNPYCDATVYLHGNCIAEITPDGTVIPDEQTFAEWPTVTTRSRLHALGVDACIRQGRAMLGGQEASRRPAKLEPETISAPVRHPEANA